MGAMDETLESICTTMGLVAVLAFMAYSYVVAGLPDASPLATTRIRAKA